ncbi:GGDEF domain-containing protein [Bowmanella sp. JS7-9]|uniref:diguanylate cyclase n=1 Tax=Pseudobowmanella zhangzhouensis TaxID=1537679 RepID=A0ABW1XIL2_9ALTE|nr:GGDEF domain-containing protein [Bowmanella sp. JS7-9]
MEQLSVLFQADYDSGFDTRRHIGQSGKLDYLQKFNLTTALIEQLALPPQLDVLLNRARHLIDLCGVELICPLGRFSAGLCAGNLTVQSYELKNGSRVRYLSQGVLTGRDIDLLDDIQHCAERPLQLAIQHLEVKRMSFVDYLTGLGNRSHYEDSIGRLVNRSLREHQGFGLLMLDLDHFKLANDQYGHLLGDQILIAVANVIKDSIRESDYAFRFGGDEFCCLLVGGDDQLNQRIALRIIHAISQHPLLAKHNISVSVGSAVFAEEDNASSVFVRADNALYAAKRSGRNCLKTA